MLARLPKTIMAQVIALSLGGLPLLAMSAGVLAAPALRADMVQSLERMQSRLDGGNLTTLADDAAAAAARLEGGNAADHWAQALFLQIAASAEARRGNDERAADLFARARGVEGVERRYTRRWLHQEARLRLRAGQTDRGVKLLGQWLTSSDAAMDDDAAAKTARRDDRWSMAQALAELKRWDEAARWVDRARQEDDAGSDAASAERLGLAASIYQRAGRDADALASLDALIAGHDVPAPIWRRAAGLAQRLDRPGRAAAIWEVGWRLGALKGDAALQQLIRLHLAGGTPARAAEYLLQALENGRLADELDNRRLLAQAWSAARDRESALKAWRTVAERSRQASDWRQLGELAYGWGRWKTAVQALRKAREIGADIPAADAARSWLLEGVATLRLGDTHAARKAFEAARTAGSRPAEAWLASLEGVAE